MLTPAAEARRDDGDVGLLYAGKIENWLPYGLVVMPKSHRDSPQTLCRESLFTSGLYFLSLCYEFIQLV